MKVTFKTLKSENFEMDFDENSTILQMKERIAQNHPDFSNETMKLVCSGKLLENGTKLSELKLTPNSFIVVMDPKKPDASPAKQPPSSQQPATTSAATRTSAQQTTVRPSIQTEEDEDLEAAMILSTPSEREQIIQDVIDMGFDRESVLLALRASYYNADRAVEYLLSGNIPTSRTSISQTSSQSEQSEVTTRQSSEILRALRSQPQFQQLREVIRQNPGMLTTVIAQIGQQHPELLEAIQANEEEFIRMLAEDEPTTESQPGASDREYVAVVSLSQEERAAIDRLKELGFSEAACVQAYFACDKDENDAANFLFNAQLDEHEQAQ